MSARSIWKGMLTIGVNSLVSLPMKAYKATDDAADEVAKRELHDACCTPTTRKTFCATCNTDVPYANIVKGVAAENGKFVVLTKEELDSITPDGTGTIVIEAFVPADEVDALYVETPYYLSADGASAQGGYATLVAALREHGKIAQGRCIIYGRERTVTVRPLGSTLVMQLMRTSTEVRDVTQLPGYAAPGAVKVDPQATKLMGQVMGMYAGTFDPTDYEDDYIVALKALVASKMNGTALTTAAVAKPALPAADLMSALKASLSAAKTVKAKTAKAATVASSGKGKKRAS